MRRALVGFLMAAAALIGVSPPPALAAPSAGVRERAAERIAEQRERRSERRAAAVQRMSEREAQAAERQERREVRREHRAMNRAAPAREMQRESREAAAERRRDTVREVIRRDRPTGVNRNVSRDGSVSRVDRHRDDDQVSPSGGGNREWHRDRVSDQHDRNHKWDRKWRHDRRYDWWSYRRLYRDLFRMGHYYNPYGWGYRRFSIGLHIGPYFYTPRYVIHDPWRYRLPEPYPGYIWVRYYDDVLLVDTFTGEVVDVIYDFFW